MEMRTYTIALCSALHVIVSPAHVRYHFHHMQVYFLFPFHAAIYYFLRHWFTQLLSCRVPTVHSEGDIGGNFFCHFAEQADFAHLLRRRILGNGLQRQE